MKFHLSIYLNKTDISEREINDSFVIGRDKSCFIQILSRIVSSEHCTLVIMPRTKHNLNEYYAIRDGVFTGNVSKNGTWVNGDRIIVSARLNHLDEITFGSRYPKVIFCALPEIEDIDTDIEKVTGASERDFVDFCEELNNEGN